jgi:PhnB protein
LNTSRGADYRLDAGSVKPTTRPRGREGSEAAPAHYDAPQGISVSIGVASPADAERIFNDLSEDGMITMPFQRIFWSAGFGMLVDRFGVPWMANCEQPA